MKSVSLLVPCSIAVVLFAGCEPESRPRIQNTEGTAGRNSYGMTQPQDGTATDFIDRPPAPSPTPGPYTDDVQDSAPEPTPAPEASPTPDPAPTPAPTTQANQLPYGTPVPGKPGFVTSPHAPYAGYVDVRGFPPNTEVKDPYSGKVFLVP